jgi:hypothetical protein
MIGISKRNVPSSIRVFSFHSFLIKGHDNRQNVSWLLVVVQTPATFDITS